MSLEIRFTRYTKSITTNKAEMFDQGRGNDALVGGGQRSMLSLP